MQDELIIEGVAVDLGDATITLEYVNNILSTFDKISSSHSYTIKLPLTATNSRVFDYVESVAHASAKVGKYLPAEYRRGGVAITRNAQAYVTAVAPDGISICLLWDGFANLSEWLAADNGLNGLEYPVRVWNGTPDKYTDSNPDVAECRYYTGVDAGVMPPPPCVSLSSVFSKVMEGTGTPYSFDAGELDGLYMPLCTRGGFADAALGAECTQIVFYPRENNQSGKPRQFIPKNRVRGAMEVEKGGIICAAIGAAMMDIGMDFTLLAPDGGLSSVVLDVVFSGRKTGTTEFVDVTRISIPDTKPSDDTSRAVKVTLSGLDVSGYDFLKMYIENTPAQITTTINGSFYCVPTTSQAEVGGNYSITANLPDISQLALIKAVCALYGAQVVLDNDGVLRFVRLEIYTENKSRAADWSSRVVNYGGVPTEVTFTLGDFARRNWLRYKDDKENLGTDADGVFVVNNETLAKEKDAAVLPWAASRYATIEHYKVNGGKVEDVDVAPRIMSLYRTVDNKMGIAFGNDLRLDERIRTYYKGLTALLADPRQIRVYVRLSAYDLAALDWLTPVYLAQTGRYYIVKTIKTDGKSDVCEATLIQMDI